MRDLVRNIHGFFYVHVPVHRNKFLYNKTNQMHEFHKFILAWNSTCFGQFFRPSSGVYSPYSQQWYMSYRFVESFRGEPSWYCSKAVYKPVWRMPLLSLRWINCWWWTEELSETCRVTCQNKFVKLVHLDGFIIKKEIHGIVMYIYIYICVSIFPAMVVCSAWRWHL
jgi:hypothetical protein